MYEKTDKLLEQVRSHPPLSEWERETLYEQHLPKFAYHSNALDGSEYTLEETTLAIDLGCTAEGKSKDGYFDVVGQRDAFRFITMQAEEKESLYERAIKEIHRKLKVDHGKGAGEYRTDQVQTRNSYVKLGPEVIPKRVKRILEIYEKFLRTRHPIDSIAMLILRFCELSPFRAGNGKVARLMMNMELIKRGYPPIVIRVEDKAAYDEALRHHQKTAAIEKMAKLIDSRLQEELEWLNERLSK